MCVINCASLYIIGSYSAKLLVLHIKFLQFLLNLWKIIEFNEKNHILNEFLKNVRKMINLTVLYCGIDVELSICRKSSYLITAIYCKLYM